MKKFNVVLTEASGGESIMDTIVAADGYTIENYTHDCEINAYDDDWMEMLRSGNVRLEQTSEWTTEEVMTEAGCTKKEAARHIQDGSIAAEAATWDKWYAEDYGCTLSDIKAGKEQDIVLVEMPDGTEYVVVYVL